jgi:tyrosinase
MVHGMPLFFPWHRRLILDFERDLQAIDSSVSLPYWDWTVANLNASATESFIWRGDFMGGPGNASPSGPVTGPFAAWGFTRRNFDPFQYPGTGGDIATARSQTTYGPFESGIEGPHGAAHVWVGGDMADVMTSPHDPAFFLLHANVDRIWAEWIRANQGTPGFQPYAPVSGGAPGQNLNDPMWPWDGSARPVAMPPWNSAPEIVRPADVIDHRSLGYYYDTIDPECRPKLKFSDDTLKFRDDPTLKFRDDPTLKFRDDPTLKFRDDPTLKFRDDPTLKFRDDPTLKFRDDLTLKFRDDKQPLETIKQIDDKAKAIDDPKGKFADDPIGPQPGASGRPFILSTPHHSMLWAGAAAESQQGAVAQLEAAIAEVEHVLTEMTEAQQRGELAPAEVASFNELQAEYESLIAEHQAMMQR